MALSEKLRSSIFRNLSPVIGEEETAAVLSYFPARDVEEPATKEHVLLETAILRTEMAGIRTEVAEVRADVANFRAEIHQTLNRWFIALVTIQIAIAGLALTIAYHQR